MNYFVEGLQGSGKSTLVKKLEEIHPELKALREGDYSPLELAWCAYVKEETYREILGHYDLLREEIEKHTVREGDHRVICYTRILTDTPGFHKDLEQYEIYNGNLSPEDFRKTILERYQNWREDGYIFECSLFQNIVEDLILFQCKSDTEILEFYRGLRETLAQREYRILYLQTTDIRGNLDVIRKERSDDQGNEMWYPLMQGYFDNSPYARNRGLSGLDALLAHFEHRQKLELQICREIFPAKVTLLPSKNYSLQEIH